MQLKDWCNETFNLQISSSDCSAKSPPTHSTPRGLHYGCPAACANRPTCHCDHTAVRLRSVTRC